MGMLGLSADELLDLTVKQFFNALYGRQDYEAQKWKANRNLIFDALRFNASTVASGFVGRKEAEKIANQKFPWEIDYSSKRYDEDGNPKPISYDAVANSFDKISK